MGKTLERDFWFDLNPDNEPNPKSNGAYIDLAQCASLVNRISLRQGMEYVVESMSIFSNGQAFVGVYRLPEHWPCINAWEKAYRNWKKQQDDNAREAGLQSTRAAYRDFKVFFDELHKDTTVGQNLLPCGYTTSSPASGSEAYEWNMSQFVLPITGGSGGAAHEVYGHMLGPDDDATPGASTTCGLIHAYGETRARPPRQDPNIVDIPADDTLYGGMIDVAEVLDDVITNYQEHNHAPPYLIDFDSAVEFYPGGQNQGDFTIGAISMEGQLENILQVNGQFNYTKDGIPGFIAPCGLIKLFYHADVTPIPGPPEEGQPFNSLLLRVTMAPGKYKGLLAQPMAEAN